MRQVVPDNEVKQYRDKANLLENLMKNIAIRRIVKIRASKSGQTIIQAVEKIVKQNKAEKAKRSRQVEKMVKREFEEMAAQAYEAQNNEEKDILYNRVVVNMKRLLKVLTNVSGSIDALERKLREISAPKGKKLIEASLGDKETGLLATLDNQKSVLGRARPGDKDAFSSITEVPDADDVQGLLAGANNDQNQFELQEDDD
jgi:hypothetical protein